MSNHEGPIVEGIIETPKGSQNKYAWSPEERSFRLKKVLPAGAVFPFDFGFIPGTIGGDGDPLDVLVLMDAPAFTGCRVDLRLVGVIEASQSEGDAKPEENDRLIAVAAESDLHRDVGSVHDLAPALLDEIEHFFVSYNDMEGRRFTVKGRHGPRRAERIVEEGRRRASGGSAR